MKTFFAFNAAVAAIVAYFLETNSVPFAVAAVGVSGAMLFASIVAFVIEDNRENGGW